MTKGFFYTAPMTPPFPTQIRPYGKAAIAEAARLIGEGLPVAMPTETVYGLAADATNPQAVARIYEAKGRPSFNPLIVHVRDLDQARELGEFAEPALRAARDFWPGPLTIVVPRRGDAIPDITTGGLATVALRCPAHPAMQALLEAVGCPLAAPSANASGAISPTSAAHVLQSLDGRIPLIIDGGDTERGIESTIVTFTDAGVVQLRPGPLSIEEVAEAAGVPVTARVERGIQSPGQLARHYAPAKPLRLDATDAKAGEWMIGFGAIEGDDTLSAGGDLVEAAARLFGALHRAEGSDKRSIAVAPIPREGLGLAINDRLRRAATSDEVDR
jgi:L-threonylcarbamoyladenylate synthase